VVAVGAIIIVEVRSANAPKFGEKERFHLMRGRIENNNFQIEKAELVADCGSFTLYRDLKCEQGKD
jgi:hypothetical protein